MYITFPFIVNLAACIMGFCLLFNLFLEIGRRCSKVHSMRKKEAEQISRLFTSEFEAAEKTLEIVKLKSEINGLKISNSQLQAELSIQKRLTNERERRYLEILSIKHLLNDLMNKAEIPDDVEFFRRLASIDIKISKRKKT